MLRHCTAAILFVGCEPNYQQGRIALLPVEDGSNLRIHWSPRHPTCSLFKLQIYFHSFVRHNKYYRQQ